MVGWHYGLLERSRELNLKPRYSGWLLPHKGQLGLDGKESVCNLGDPGSLPLGQEDSLEKRMATCSRILAWKNSMDRRAF